MRQTQWLANRGVVPPKEDSKNTITLPSGQLRPAETKVTPGGKDLPNFQSDAVELRPIGKLRCEDSEQSERLEKMVRSHLISQGDVIVVS